MFGFDHSENRAFGQFIHKQIIGFVCLNNGLYSYKWFIKMCYLGLKAINGGLRRALL